jgi:hypothetical protein
MLGQNIADNKEDITKHRRRHTDNVQMETNLPSSGMSNRMRLFGGVLSVGFVSAMLTTGVWIGKYSSTVDAMALNDKIQNERIETAIVTLAEVVVILKNQGIQQQDSDKRFEEKFDESNQLQNKVLDELKDQREKIIILNQKISLRDDTRVEQLALLTE